MLPRGAGGRGCEGVARKGGVMEVMMYSGRCGVCGRYYPVPRAMEATGRAGGQERRGRGEEVGERREGGKEEGGLVRYLLLNYAVLAAKNCCSFSCASCKPQHRQTTRNRQHISVKPEAKRRLKHY